mgnify:FL=1|jgi:hypothetical protein
MTDRPVNLSMSGPPETILDPEPAAAIDALRRAEASPEPIAAIGAVCTEYPRCIEAWAALGDVAQVPALRYAAYRTGYHRGLDRLRANGWRGSGFVRWRSETNRGFLRSLSGLQAIAAMIGESDEEERCALFLRQLDPDWPPPSS